MSYLRRKLIGNRAFYAMVMAVVVPIIIQNAITNFVSLLDNLMVGAVGAEEMSGVSIANQLMFVFNLAVFGAVSGAGIFAAQYHGAGDTEGVRASFRYKLYIGLIISVGAIVLFLTAGRQLTSLYLTDGDDPVRVAETLGHAVSYIRIMCVGLIPFALVQSYAGTLRETGETRVPMVAGVVAVLVNLVFNYILIFGKFGAPAMGVRGAAYATVLSRYVELAIVVVYSHTHKQKYRFVEGLYSTLKIPKGIVKEITIKGMPLLVNEFLWSLGTATLSQTYSTLGLDVVEAISISSTITNVFAVVFLSLGSAASIIVGQALGANEIDTAKDHTVKLLAFSCFLSACVGVVLAVLSPFIPMLYSEIRPEVRGLASQVMRVYACFTPAMAFCNCGYFVMRSGGKTGITFIFDSGCMWVVCVPVAMLITRFSGFGIVGIFACVQCVEVFKSFIAAFLLYKGIWINNIVSNEQMQLSK